jgi:hypothetical protein
MDDVICDLLPQYAPLEMLYVNKRARKISLEWLCYVRVSPADDLYYDIIRILGANKMTSRIGIFTKLNFELKPFKKLCYEIQVRDVEKKLFVAFKHYDSDNLNKIITFMCYKLPAVYVMQITRRHLSCEQIYESKYIKGAVETLFDHHCWMVYESKYNRKHDEGCVDDRVFDDEHWYNELANYAVYWTILYFPDIIDNYLYEFVTHREPMNGSFKCVNKILDLSMGRIHEQNIDLVSRILIAPKYMRVRLQFGDIIGSSEKPVYELLRRVVSEYGMFIR